MPGTGPPSSTYQEPTGPASVKEPERPPDEAFADTWVVVPVYNEATVIGDVVRDLGERFPNIVCIDDGSTDGSAYFVTFDADGQHDVADAARMVGIARSDDVDVVLGSRFLGSHAEVPKLKRLVLRTAVALSPATRRLGLTDAHNGLRVLTRTVVEEIRIEMNGMAHASEIVAALANSSWRVREAPVTIHYSEYSMKKGQSLINGVNILFDLSVRNQR